MSDGTFVLSLLACRARDLLEQATWSEQPPSAQTPQLFSPPLPCLCDAAFYNCV